MHPQIQTGLIKDVKEKMIKKKKEKGQKGFHADSHSTALRQSAASLHFAWELSSCGHKGQGERARDGDGEKEKLISAFVEFPHLPLEEAVHLGVPFINVSLSFSPPFPPSPPYFYLL